MQGVSDLDLVCTSIGTAAGTWDINYAARGGITPSIQWCRLTNAYALTNATGVQKLFNASTNGALTVTAATKYEFECWFQISGMSATSGNAAFSLAGTATLTNVTMANFGVDASTTTTVAALNGAYAVTAATPASAQTAGTGTAMWTLLKGTFTVNAGGTIIPSINLVTASAASVAVGSYFKVMAIGSANQVYVGNWN